MAKDKKPNEIVSFYGGRAQVEIQPWGDHFRYKRVGERTGYLSVTAVTKNLDKSHALIPWAVKLVGTHITSFFEASVSNQFSKEEIFVVVAEAVLKPEEAKVKGGTSGDFIHDFAHDFAKSKRDGSTPPTIAHLDQKDETHMKALNGINAFLEWYNANEVEFLEMEKLVYYNSFLAGDSKEGEVVIEFIGILDLLARVNGVVGVWDYKSSKGIYSDQRYQNSAYWKAYNSDNALKAEVGGILNFGKETGELIKGEYPTVEVTKDFDFGFKGLYLTTLREKELEAERTAAKKAEAAKITEEQLA